MLTRQRANDTHRFQRDYGVLGYQEHPILLPPCQQLHYRLREPAHTYRLNFWHPLISHLANISGPKSTEGGAFGAFASLDGSFLWRILSDSAP